MESKEFVNQKDLETLQIIQECYKRIKDIDVGLPLQVVFNEVRHKGIYQSDKYIAKKIKKLEDMGLIKVKDWNIIEVNP